MSQQRRAANPPAPPVIVWFRNDLRLGDNPALAAALAAGGPLIALYILDEALPGGRPLGGAARWWLHHSLTALAADLAASGAKLILRRGPIRDVLPALVRETGAAEIHAGQPVEPWARAAIGQLDLGATLHLHRTTTLFEPTEIRTGAGGPYGVFSPFARACIAHGPPPPLALPARIEPPATPPPSDALDAWGLLPTRPDWAGGLRETWQVGEAAARRRLERFARTALGDYATARNLPGIDSTAMLSPYLHWGEISPGAAWHAADGGGAGAASWRNELLWREFSAHLLWHNPDLPERPLRREFAAMPWRDDPAGLGAWRRGRTGVPIVDAGMRQLWHTGWMHNRVRMIVASFLVKHLLLPWRDGAAWFWDTLVDADLASNSASWQWVAGCGADAAPYFRIFNPVLQGLKFDADGAYVRRWVPELAKLPDKLLHAPWDAAPLDLAASGVVLGRMYPRPIVDLAAGRARALAALEAVTAARA